MTHFWIFCVLPWLVTVLKKNSCYVVLVFIKLRITLLISFILLFLALLLKSFREKEVLYLLIELLFLSIQFFQLFWTLLTDLRFPTLFHRPIGEGRKGGFAERNLQILNLPWLILIILNLTLSQISDLTNIKLNIMQLIWNSI